MQRLLGFLGGRVRFGSPRSPGTIAWRPMILAAMIAMAALAIYEIYKFFAT